MGASEILGTFLWSVLIIGESYYFGGLYSGVPFFSLTPPYSYIFIRVDQVLHHADHVKCTILRLLASDFVIYFVFFFFWGGGL